MVSPAYNVLAHIKQSLVIIHWAKNVPQFSANWLSNVIYRTIKFVFIICILSTNDSIFDIH